MKAVVTPARWALALAVLGAAGPVSAQVSLTTLGSAYTQDFNTLANSGTTNTTVPAGWAFLETGTSANTTYAAGTGSDTAGNTYSFGAASSTERAFGALQSGSVIPSIGAAFTNDTGATITDLAIAFTGEQWRIGNNTTARDDRLDFEYSTDATGLGTGTWTAVTALNFVNPIKTAASAGLLDGNAAANRTAVSGSISGLSIPAGTTFWIRWKDFNATGADDGLAIDDFSLTPSGAVPLPNLSINDVSVTEGAAGNTVTASFTVSLSAPAPAGGVTFNIATADGTATTADSDYVAKSLTAQTIAAGGTSYTFDVTVNGDSAIEPDETFLVNITSVTGATVTDGQGQGTILNDDAVMPQLSINDVSVTEGNVGTTIPAQFTITSSVAAPAGGYTLNFATADGTATVADSDYLGASGTVTIPAGQTTATVNVTVNGDDNVEPNETFVVNLSSAPAGTQIADAQGQGTILNDDAYPVLSIGNASVVEGHSGTALLNFPLTLTAAAPAAGITFTVNTTDGTATAGSDYVAILNGSGSIAAGQTSGTLAVTINGDTVAEPNETFTVTLSAPVNATLGTATATGTIVNDDAVEIHDIQGTGLASPLANQGVLTVNNIVTGKGPQGFTMQAPDARADADTNTSEAVYVFTSTAPTVQVGDLVNVAGTVTEFNGLTEITSATITVVSSGNALPTPVEFNATVPSPNPATPTCTVSGSNFECFEFMRVHIADGLVSTGNQRFASPATETFAEAFITADGRRGVREPGLLYPLVPTAGNLAAGQWDGNPELFELDADYFGAVPVDTPLVGNTRFTATGVLGYDFGDYELWATELNLTSAAAVPRPVRDSHGNTDLRIGAFNMLRFCDTTNNGTGSDPCLAPTPTQAQFDAKVARLSAYIKDVLKLPDVLGTEEVENLTVLQALAAKLTTDSGVPYTARLEEGNDIGGIDVGFLVRTDRVTINTVTQLGKTMTWNDPTGSPTALLHDRPPLLLEASFIGGSGSVPFAVMVVHPKSRSCVDAPTGASCVQADVDRNRQKRFLQGKYHAEQIQAFQQAHPGTILTVVGDFNDYQFSDGWTHMVGAMEGRYDDAANLLDYAGNTVVNPPLWNAVMSLPENDRYSFTFTENFGVFQGFNTRDVPTLQVLDHGLLSATARSLFAGFDYGRADNDAPAEWERQCNLVPTPAPPACPHPAIGVSDHDGFVFVLATDRIFSNGYESAQ
ncbi:MAG TPA: Calx-beta domain-containing protein [Tahibacter sp.]|nr:Calx-beta domain-containing protein [Tahibacter sp.]